MEDGSEGIVSQATAYLCILQTSVLLYEAEVCRKGCALRDWGGGEGSRVFDDVFEAVWWSTHAGGIDRGSKCLDSVEYYDPRKFHWVEGTALPHPCANMAAIALSGKDTKSLFDQH